MVCSAGLTEHGRGRGSGVSEGGSGLLCGADAGMIEHGRGRGSGVREGGRWLA